MVISVLLPTPGSHQLQLFAIHVICIFSSHIFQCLHDCIWPGDITLGWKLELASTNLRRSFTITEKAHPSVSYDFAIVSQFYIYIPYGTRLALCHNRFLNVKVLVGTFNQEKAQVRSFSVIVKLRWSFVDRSNGNTSREIKFYHHLCHYNVLWTNSVNDKKVVRSKNLNHIKEVA